MLQSAYFADGQFGGDPAAMQPTPTAVPEHLGGPEPMAKTIGGGNRPTESPALAVVVLLGVAALILHLIQR